MHKGTALLSEDLSKMTKEELTRVRNLGKINHDEILEKSYKIGISLVSEDKKLP